jgi:outer membrane protein TolC
MNRQLRSAVAVLLTGLVVLTGCHPTQPFYLHEDGDLSHYIETATEIEHPDVEAHSLDEVKFAQAPLTLSNPEPKELWDLSLEEAVATTLQNSKVLRQLGGAVAVFRGQRNAPDNLLRFSDQANTIYQPGLQSSSTLNFGGASGIPGVGIPGLGLAGVPGTPGVGGGRAGISGQGVEDALAAHDAHFSTSIFWNTTDRPQNIDTGQIGADRFSPFVLQDNQATFQSQIAKRTMEGTEMFLRTRTNYERGNSRGGVQALNSFYTQEVEVEARHPLLRGSGTQVNRIPIMLARTNEDIALADFEANVRNLVSDVETAYWDLYASYRDLEAAKAARDSMLEVWRNAYAGLLEGREGAESYNEAQAREQYLSFRSQVEENYVVLLARERNLRYLMGLTTSDSRLVRPKDEPTTALVEFEWCEVQAEALARSAELRRHKWRIKQRELELIYYRNQLLPQLDVVGLYRWVGMGDHLASSDRNGFDFPQENSTAWEGLTEGDYQEARVGVQLSPPQFGARRELARIRHQQLLLAESKAILEDMELTVLHRVTNAIVNADAEYHLAQSAFNRWVAAQREVNARTAVVQEGGKPDPNFVTNLLDALRRQADAQREYYQRLVNYNKAIADVHLAKGSLLEYDGVYLAEGPWPKKAYWDALGHARQRDASMYLDYGWTQPKVISRGPTDQMTPGAVEGEAMPFGMPSLAPAQEGEEILTPTPMPEGGEQPAPEQLPAPPTLDRSIMLPEFTSRSGGESSRPNVAKTAASKQGNTFDWGNVGADSPRKYEVRQAAAELELEPPQNAASAKSNAIQWIEPGSTSSRPIASGNWKSSVR